MSAGDQSDVLSRLKTVLPRWFGDSSPILDAVLSGLAWAGSFIYSLYAYAVLQTRISSATDGWLDMIAGDFFGISLLRNASESDSAYRRRILLNLIRERGTRASVISVLTDLTGRIPIVFEPRRLLDTGALGTPLSRGYCNVARMGSMAVPFTAMVTAFRPMISFTVRGAAFCSTPSFSALGTALSSGYTGQLLGGPVTDADIYAAVDSVKPAGTILWVGITN